MQHIQNLHSNNPSKGARQKLLSVFFPLRGYPPLPTPLMENHFSKKPLAEKGGIPRPPLTESPLSFSGKFFPKRAKNDVFFFIK